MQVRALRLLAGVCLLALNRFPTSLTEDEQLLTSGLSGPNGALTPDRLLAISFRAEKKRAAQDALKSLTDTLKARRAASCTCVRSLLELVPGAVTLSVGRLTRVAAAGLDGPAGPVTGAQALMAAALPRLQLYLWFLRSTLLVHANQFEMTGHVLLSPWTPSARGCTMASTSWAGHRPHAAASVPLMPR